MQMSQKQTLISVGVDTYSLNMHCNPGKCVEFIWVIDQV